MSKSEKGLGRHRVDLLLPLRLRRIFYKLLAGASLFRDERGYAALQRVASLLCELEREIGFNGVKKIMRRIERLEKLADKKEKR